MSCGNRLDTNGQPYTDNESHTHNPNKYTSAKRARSGTHRPFLDVLKRFRPVLIKPDRLDVLNAQERSEDKSGFTDVYNFRILISSKYALPTLFLPLRYISLYTHSFRAKTLYLYSNIT